MASSIQDEAFEQSEKSMGYTESAWALYEKLELRDREDISLKAKLLAWLSKNRNEAAETRCLELYHAIPADYRTLTVYKSALATFMRSNLYGLAQQAHAEALDMLANGHEISAWLCGIAIENDMWDMASKVKQQLDGKHKGEAIGWMDNMFWSQISETPDLLSRAIGLSKHYRMLKQADAITSDYQRFSVNLFKVAIIQQFTSTGDKKKKVSKAERTFNDGRIRYLFSRMQLTDAEAGDFCRHVIGALIRPDSNVYYPDAHKTVSHIYRQYRMLPRVRPHEKLLFDFMKRAVEYANTTAGRLERSLYISPSKLEEDWVALYGRMSMSIYVWIMLHYARNGSLERVRYYSERLLEQYPSYHDHKDALWILVYVHARRGEVKAAKTAFEGIRSSANDVGEIPELRVWNVLLHAHSRADDLDGALEVLSTTIASGHKPNVYTMHPVLELYAAKGDVDGVEDLLEQFDQLGDGTRGTEMYGSIMTAHVNGNDVVAAHKVLEALIPKVQAGEVRGTLTKCFNILLTALALRRKVDETMQVFRWMKAEQVKANNFTYAALMQALTAHRQADAAWNILETVMPDQGLKPTAFHYAVVMSGFMRQRAFKVALEIHKKMISRGIKPTLSTNAIYVKCRAQYELRQNRENDGQDARYPVGLIVDELEEIFNDPAAGLAVHEPQYYSPAEDHSPRTLLITQLLYVYGSFKAFSAVQELLRRYHDLEKKDDQGEPEPLPLKILSAVMPAFIYAKRWDETEQCWNLAKAQADALTISRPVPRLTPVTEAEKAPEILKLSVAKTTSQAQAQAATTNKNPPTRTARLKPETADPTRPVPALQHILSQPLRHHITSLALQSRFAEMISVVASSLSQGYVLDNSTWNIFIEHLLRPAHAPLALLAFRLTERYLIPSWPGWRHGRQPVNISHRRQGLEHIRASYLSPDQLMPQYRTMVKLGAALLEIRRRDALGVKSRKGDDQGLSKYVGTVRQIRQHAPKTLFAVQSMPTVEDRLQTKLLRREHFS